MSVDTEVQARLGQALAAFGQGSGAIRIPRATVTKFFDTFRGPFRAVIKTSPGTFTRKASYLLDVFRTLGRLSADYATAKGSSTIDPDHFVEAFLVVQAAERQKNNNKPTDFCGGISPLPPKPPKS